MTIDNIPCIGHYTNTSIHNLLPILLLQPAMHYSTKIICITETRPRALHSWIAFIPATSPVNVHTDIHITK